MMINKLVLGLMAPIYFTDSPDKLTGDYELKWWREELVKPRDQSGVGLKDIPGNAEEGKDYSKSLMGQNENDLGTSIPRWMIVKSHHFIYFSFSAVQFFFFFSF